MSELSFLSLGSENDYYIKFKEVYSEEIKTPDGFCVVCINKEKTAKHFCGGKTGIFQKGRASRIEWAKYVLLKPEERIVLKDKKTGNIIFFYEKKRTCYAVVCSEMKNGNLSLISGFLVGEDRAKKYREGKPPYEFY